MKWMAEATSSFPVPLSPWIMTVASEPATSRISQKTSCIPLDLPMMFEKE